MLKNTLLISAILCLSIIAASAQTASRDNDTLRSLVKQMTDAQTAFDAKTLDRIYTADFIDISPVGEFDERAKVLGFYKPELKPDPATMTTSVEQTEFSIRNYGKFAIVIARLNFAITSAGKALPPRSMRVMIVCRKEKNEWKIASAQYTGIRSAPPKSS